MARTILPSALLVCALLQGISAAAETVRYGDAHPEQALDFSWPEGPAKATVLFLHGGSLKENGERRSSPVYSDVCSHFVSAGYGCASADYRLSPTFKWPAMAEDVAAAVRKVRELIQARGGDPGKLFLFGHSSGCHLAAVLGTNRTYLEHVGLQPSDLAGVIAMGCTLDHHDAALRGLTVDFIRGPFNRDPDEVSVYGTPENWLAANPASHLGPHTPPTLVVVAENERFFPSILEQGARFVRQLLEVDVPANLVIVPGTHMGSIDRLGDSGDPTFSAILAFLADPKAKPQ